MIKENFNKQSKNNLVNHIYVNLLNNDISSITLECKSANYKPMLHTSR